MSTIIEELKDVLKAAGLDISQLKGAIAEAEKPVIRTIADTAWIYNGYADITLHHVGIPYFLKAGEVTRIDGLPDYQEVDQNTSSGKDLNYRPMPLKGEYIAREMIDNRKFGDYGFVVFTDGPEIKPEVKAAADERAIQHKKQAIEQFKIGREKAKSGTAGYKINPDPQIYQWMKQYSPDDPMFAEQSTKTEANNEIARAIAMMAQLLGAQQQPKTEAVTVNTATPVVSESQSTEESKSEKPKRKPFESKEDYAKRLAEMEAETVNA